MDLCNGYLITDVLFGPALFIIIIWFLLIYKKLKAP